MARIQYESIFTHNLDNILFSEYVLREISDAKITEKLHLLSSKMQIQSIPTTSDFYAEV